MIAPIHVVPLHNFSNSFYTTCRFEKPLRGFCTYTFDKPLRGLSISSYTKYTFEKPRSGFSI